MPVMLLVPARAQVRLAAVVAIVALTYPMVRSFNLIPLDTVVQQAAEISGPDRAHSHNYRFQDELQPLARAAEKPLFGWGGWGRILIRYIQRNQSATLAPYIGPVSLVLGVTMMDILLNATLTPITWLAAGAVRGYIEKLNPCRARQRRYKLHNHPMMNSGTRHPQKTILWR